jgi:hypothetical protein
MKFSAFKKIAQALHEEDVRYLLAGGLAVVAHGYGRMTFDVDLIVQLKPENIIKAFRALRKVGYQPRVPVTAEQFADRTTREGRIRDKGMVVMNMWSDEERDTPVDLFVTEPFDFDAVYGRSPLDTLDDGTPFRFVEIPTLIAMKRIAGREKDMDDIRHLEMIAREI